MSGIKEDLRLTKQVNKQKQLISGDFSEGTQTASNRISVLNVANAVL